MVIFKTLESIYGIIFLREFWILSYFLCENFVNMCMWTLGVWNFLFSITVVRLY